MSPIEPTAEPITAPTSESPEVSEETREQKIERFTHLIVDGRKHLLVGTYDEANKSLGEACELSDELYGEKATEGFEAYYYYGRSLLELSRLESGVLSAALDGVKDESRVEDKKEEDPTVAKKDDSMVEGTDQLSEEKHEEVRGLVEDALAENAEALEKGTLTKEDEIPKDSDDKKKSTEGEEKKSAEDVERENKPAEDVEANTEGTAAEAEKPTDAAAVGDKTENQSEIVDKTEESADAMDENDAAAEKEKNASAAENETEENAAEETVAAGDEENEEADDEEEPSNLQLAWEVLEVARLIAVRNKDVSDSWKQKEIDVCTLLGEVLIEDQKYPEAIEELSNAMKLVETHMGPDNRIIAETHFQIGRALGCMSEFMKASESYKTAATVLKTRIGNLKSELEKSKTDDEKKKVSDEITELEQLVPDITEMVEDSIGSAKSMAEKAASENAEGNVESSTVGFDKSKATTDEAKVIEIKARKPNKRDIESVSNETEESSGKKAKTDESAGEAASA